MEQATLESDVPPTSEIPFFSSLHGRQRRQLRGIDRKDLQAAVKHGKKERGSPHPVTGARRWKYTWADIVYITDETSTKEVTSYAKPISIPRANLMPESLAAHEAARKRLTDDPSQCTSHTVIVVDQSGSMRTSDVFDFKDRSKAVFGMLAIDFVAERCLSGGMTETDVVSLVLMRDEAEVAFEREPMGLVLYDRFVGLHDGGVPRSHGNFIPALEEAERLLGSQWHGEYALSLFFLSDGKPSDRLSSPWSIPNCDDAGMKEVISGRMKLLGERFGDQLVVSTFGFAHREQDFSVLEGMANAARDAGAKGEFYRSELSSHGLSTAITRSISSLQATISRCTSLTRYEGPPRMARQIEHEDPRSIYSQVPHHYAERCPGSSGEGGWMIHSGAMRFEFSLRRMHSGRDPWVPVKLISPGADSIAVRIKCLGVGAERVVFGLQEYNSTSGRRVGPQLVSKESKYVGYTKMKFHESFAATQQEAIKFAEKFNERVKQRLFALGSDVARKARVWRISFLPCQMYTYNDGTEDQSILVEKMLEPTCRYKKWNSNNGWVCGGAALATARSGSDIKCTGKHGLTRAAQMMDPVMEEDEEGYDSDGAQSASSNDEEQKMEDGDGDHTSPGCVTSGDNGSRVISISPAFYFDPSPECYLQAFSHFSYRSSLKEMLVCDLQGVMERHKLSVDGYEGLFELTDPAIHYRSRKEQERVYGRTDFGRKGIREFFKTHYCNDVCVLLGLSSSNQKDLRLVA